MIVQQLRYEEERATRYSDPPSMLTFERPTLDLLDHYGDLLKLRDRAKVLHGELIKVGVFESIPTMTTETHKDRPGRYWRAVFRINSPEVLSGKARKHYIGNDEAKVQVWEEWISRTRVAMHLDRLIHDMGMDLKMHCRRVNDSARMLASVVSKHGAKVEELAG